MHVRHATAEDVPAITAIYNDAVLTTTASFDLEPKNEDDRRVWLEEHVPRYPVLVATHRDQVLGWGSLSQFSDRAAYDGTAEISVYVQRDSQRRGVGRALTVALLDEARAGDFHVIIARICTENLGSIAMVRSLGFVEAGTVHEVGCKFGRWLDVVSWEYLLSRGPCVS